MKVPRRPWLVRKPWIASGIAGVTACLLATTAVLAFRAVPPGTSATGPDARAARLAPSVVRGGRARCNECGFIVSSEPIASDAGDPLHQTTVRFPDGSTTVFTDTDERPRRVGSRVIVIR